MAPNRFKKDTREKREVTPFNGGDMNSSSSSSTNNNGYEISVADVVPSIPAEWRDIEAPINFTWVCQDELAGMGWPKSRDQVRFCVEQGIDHLVTLSPEKYPPHYAFPDLKWTSIPVEDFTGPTISEIKKFITIMDEARKEGEAVGVHCAEGRGRTGVMCACYLIYYHDIKPWDAIRIMRRQRPGSVERKVQEETVVKFWTLLQDYGKSTLERLEEKEREMKNLQRKVANDNLLAENLLLSHTARFYGPTQNAENKVERLQRMRRARSMPKINQEEEEEIHFRQHMLSFFNSKEDSGDKRSRSQPRRKTKEEKNAMNEDSQRRERAVTPGRSLVENLKPVERRKSRKQLQDKQEDGRNDFTKHFKDFMSTANPVSLRKLRSQSQPRETEQEEENELETAVSKIKTIKVYSNPPSRKDSFEEKEKCVQDSHQPEENTNKIRIRRRRARTPTPEPEEPSSSNNSGSSGTEESWTESDKGKKCEEDKETNQCFKPKFTVDSSSSTYSYYTRIRSRAAEAATRRRVEAEKHKEESSNNLRKPSLCTVTVTLVESDNTPPIPPPSFQPPPPPHSPTTRIMKKYERTSSKEKRQQRLSNNVKYINNDDRCVSLSPASERRRIKSSRKSTTPEKYRRQRRSRTNPLESEDDDDEEEEEEDEEEFVRSNHPSSTSRYNSSSSVYNYKNNNKNNNSYLCTSSTNSSSKCTSNGHNFLNNYRPSSSTGHYRFHKTGFNEYPKPFVRDSWKRTNQRFNYSRFLSSSQETFV